MNKSIQYVSRDSQGFYDAVRTLIESMKPDHEFEAITIASDSPGRLYGILVFNTRP